MSQKNNRKIRIATPVAILTFWHKRALKKARRRAFLKGDQMIFIDFSWADATIGFIVGMIVTTIAIIVGFYIGEKK